MNQRRYIALFVITLTCTVAWAQTEFGGQGLSGADIDKRSQLELKPQLKRDSLKLDIPPVPPLQSGMEIPGVTATKGFNEQSSMGGAFLPLWQGGYLGFFGSNYHLPGLMNTAAGSMGLYQDWGRWHFTASAMANKYWMPWQHRLSTQYGFGGTMGYDLSEAISLHAFGYYYANQMQVGPAFSPYMNTTTYGGYADIRFSNAFGTNVGVRRYLNPMNGKWETEPIINPYVKIGNGKLELPLGGLLKSLIWGDRDNSIHNQHGIMPSQPKLQSNPQPVRPALIPPRR
ncbi:MAG: hypothetical protein J5682_01535 [Prevotella sp.]|nr:hypothetical protein [Prevotella sp.]